MPQRRILNTIIPVLNQIHGHEVLNMMLTSGKTYSKQSLTEDIVRNFGSNARFYACSAENMTAAQLVEFLQARGKFIAQDDGFQTSADLQCKH